MSFKKIKEGMYVEIVYEDLSGCTTKFQLSNQKKHIHKVTESIKRNVFHKGCRVTTLTLYLD